jgi:thiamine-phosphate pyrophosphorylase
MSAHGEPENAREASEDRPEATESAVLRIADANLNRAREALRVIEDYARFALDDADAGHRTKQLRHQLTEIRLLVGADRLIDARAIASDVGRDLKTTRELRRDMHEDVVAAAFARLSEASRSLGEHAKLLSSEVAAMAETLRYEAYALEPLVLARGRRRAAFRQTPLYVILTERLCHGGWQETAAAALKGGATCLQLREKDLDDRELLRRAGILRELTSRHDALLIINDRPDIARLCGADGVHVGQDDLSAADVRRIAGGAMLVGKSTHTVEQFDAALAEHPDYIAIGPMYATQTKPQSHIAGPETLKQVAGRTELPVVAIGGIGPGEAHSLIAAGASCLAVCSAVIAAPAPAAAAVEFIESLGTI